MKKAFTILLAISFGFALLTLLLLFMQVSSAQADQDVLYVAPEGNCGPITVDCYASIQAAVDHAAPGDEIHIATGIYTNTSIRPRSDFTTTGVVTQVVYVSKTVTIRGGYNSDFSAWDPDAYPTTLDAQARGRGLYVTGIISPVIEGLRITGGDAAGQGGYEYYGIYDAGGGIYVLTATPTLINNQVFSNTAQYGGGVFMGNSTGRLADSLVANNQAVDGSGGGVFVFKGDTRLDGNTITTNTSTILGGGIYLFYTQATLTNNTVANNTAVSNGGGVQVASCSPIFNGNIIAGNVGRKGGGVLLWYSRATFRNNVIVDNQAQNSGSGLWIGGSEPILWHTTIARNAGGDGSGVFFTDAGTIHSTVVMTNTLLISHTVGISVTADSTANLDSVLWYSTPITVSQMAATVNIQNQHHGDPAFDLDGYHLTSGSEAIDKGTPTDVHFDIDGQPRFASFPDLGADEYWLPGSPRYIYLPVIIRND